MFQVRDTESGRALLTVRHEWAARVWVALVGGTTYQKVQERHWQVGLGVAAW